MFKDWKQAWQQAVENFQRELGDDDSPSGSPQIGSMRSDLGKAKAALQGLAEDLVETRKEVAAEEEAERTCIRRKELAERIGDQETVRLAEEWAQRHSQRADLLRRKVEILAAELEMRREELRRMEVALEDAVKTVTAGGATAGGAAPGEAAAGSVGGASTNAPEPNPERSRQDAAFRRLDQEARERAAQARLEELKKRML